jgi:hypothetical protein
MINDEKIERERNIVAHGLFGRITASGRDPSGLELVLSCGYAGLGAGIIGLTARGTGDADRATSDPPDSMIMPPPRMIAPGMLRIPACIMPDWLMACSSSCWCGT